MATDTNSKLNASHEALLEAAVELFSRKGYAAVSTREIAERAEVNLGAIQYHFGSKSNLFVATVHRLMEGQQCVRGHLSSAPAPRDTVSAATGIASFVHSFLDYILNPKGPEPCRLMLREIFSDTSEQPEMFEALVSTVAEQFMRPVHGRIQECLRVILPESDDAHLSMVSNSLIAQCVFYATHRPFIERLQGISLARSDAFESIYMHVTAFTLRGCGVDEITIREVIDPAKATWLSCGNNQQTFQ